ncbi:MAG: hypothetical protein ACYTEZ_12630 [Planctomycetota bacterium]|jgi:hypothetical protein
MAARNALAQRLRPLQIVLGLLSGGAVLFAAVALLIRAHRDGVAPETTVFTVLAVGFAAVALGLALLLPGTIAAHGRKQIGGGASRAEGDEPLLRLYETCLVLAAAVLDAAALFACTAYLVEGSPVSLALGGVVLPGAIAARFPTRARFERWLAEQTRRLEA